MNKSFIVLVAGEAEHGKDTICTLVKELWAENHYRGSKPQGNIRPIFYKEFKEIKFADPINKTICDITGFTLEYVTNKENYNKPIAWLDNRTLRDLKQQIGQGMKTILGEDIWIKSSFSKVSPHDNVLVSDMRFPKEQGFALEDLTKTHYVITIFVTRPGHKAETLNESNKNDVSETSVSLLDKSKFHHLLINDGSRKQLKNRVKGALETHEVWKRTYLKESF